ncbi:sarcosine oxidase subunit alpha family protein [Nocardiopsis rhodophaea]|uniref:Sarcosine oxidase subunit alpha family protein n=2 Tax=Nocardiopsis rhodophaea TaxID=280238 RepID=A0ABN2TCL7_9ACTN
MSGRRPDWNDPTGVEAPYVGVVFDGRALTARAGEPLSASLLAAGVRTVGTSISTGRPRGVYTADAAEPCAYVRVDSSPGEAMAQATRVETYDGLRAAGLAGYARLPDDREPARADKSWAHCDVLVVGAGPAGLAAALAAARVGARVILADERPHPGGDLLGSRRHIDGTPAAEWIAAALAELHSHPEVRVFTRTTVTGHYDHGEHIALERRPRQDATGNVPDARPRPVSYRLWRIRTRRTVLATGAGERPFAFQGNDRPGVMLAGAAARYAWRYGVLPGRRAVVSGCHDEALWAAVDLHDAGIELAAVADARPAPGTAPVAALRERGVDVLTEHAATRTVATADGVLSDAALAPVDRQGRVAGPDRTFACDLLAVSGGHDPAIALASHTGMRPRWSPPHAAFLPGPLPDATHCVGAAAGTRSADAARAAGHRAGQAAAVAALRTDGTVPAPRAADGTEGQTSEEDGTGDAAGGAPPMALWAVTAPHSDAALTFVDLHRDVTLADLRAAIDAGMTSIEHIKRFTTVGTGPDQGRTSGVLTAGIVAQWLDRSMDQVGGARQRPPVAPVPFAALAGPDRGDLLYPARRTPMHDWHVAHGAVFEDVGQWKRPRYYPRGEEDMRAAVLRECHAAREGVAVLDASTLGKIIVSGHDAPVFLDRIYTGKFSTLRVGRCRYGVMCGADGMVLDDGVAVRLADHSYLVTTTSGNAETVLAWLEEWAQEEWPDLCVHFTHATDHFATVSVVGPRARDVMARIAPDLDVSAEGFPFMTFRDTTVAGVSARVLRVSFTGELTFEIYVSSWYGRAVWEAVMAAGEPHAITPYGTETMHVLRAEKGFIVVGHETDGSVTPIDLGMEWAVSKRKDFVGKRSLSRADTAREDREQLVGLLPDDAGHVLAEGAQLVAGPPGAARNAPTDSSAAWPTPTAPPPRPAPTQGRVTSAYDSAALGRTFGLGLLRGGRERHGERLYAVHLDRIVPVTVTDPVFYDKEGLRRDG